MTQTTQHAALDPTDPRSWSALPFETLFSLSREEVRDGAAGGVCPALRDASTAVGGPRQARYPAGI